MKILSMVVLIAAIAPGAGQASSLSAGEQAACAVRSAIPGDGVDDRVEIQNALTSQGCAYLPACTTSTRSSSRRLRAGRS
jgi:hypothetical protein